MEAHSQCFAVLSRSAFESAGEMGTFNGQSFYPMCGSQVVHITEADIMTGTLDNSPTDLVPEYEIWTPGREPWLQPVVGAKQYN